MPWGNYRGRPVEYASEILGEELTADQQAIARSIHEPPFMSKVDSGHSLGKSFLAAVLVNYWYDTYPDGVVVTTAPTKEHVETVLWAEVRLLRSQAHGPALGSLTLPMDFIGPIAPEMRTGQDHWAKGLVASKGESFQGRHRSHMLFIFDEDEGLPATYFLVTKTMFKAEAGHAWLSIGNPTTTVSPAFLETQKVNPDGSPMWRLFRLSALNHPNVEAELAGRPPVIPNAITVAQLDLLVRDLCEQIDPAAKEVGDFEWRPGSGQWWRPGPDAESRIFGRRPSQGTHGVWSMALWDACEQARLPIDLGLVPQIGLDCAWKGDDWTCFHIRWGGTSLKHESYNGWSAPKIAFRLKELCQWAAEHANAVRCANGLATARPIDPKEIPCKIDDDATGGAVIALSEGYRFIPVGASQRSFWEERYPNKRSELWFTTRERAMAGMLDVSQLPRDVRERLRVQLLSVTWEPDAKGRRQVEKKDDTKEKINRSPDDADACNLSYSEVGEGVAHWVDPPSDGRTMGAKLGLFGRGQDASPSYRERSRPRTLGRR